MHAPSAIALQQLIDKNLISREEMLEICQNSYKSFLRAVSYTLSEDKKKITIYSHAAIDLKTIAALARKLNITYQDQTAEKLAETIDNINTIFQNEYVQEDKVHTLYDSDVMMKGYKGEPIDHEQHPLEFSMWNRHYDMLNRPENHHDYAIDFVHGHDNNERTVGNIYNLDNALGKSLLHHQGQYNILYSKETPGQSFSYDDKINSGIENLLKVLSRKIDRKIKNLIDKGYNEEDEVVLKLRRDLDEAHIAHQNGTLNFNDLKERLKIITADLAPPPLDENVKSENPEHKFESCLLELKLKGQELINDGYINKGEIVSNLHKDITNKFVAYKDGALGYDEFKMSCNTMINDSIPALSKTQGCKEILLDILKAIANLGKWLYNVLTGSKNSSCFFKASKQHPAVLAENVKNSIEALAQKRVVGKG